MDRAARLGFAALSLAALAGCAAVGSDHSGLRIEQRPAENIVRISNDAPHNATLYHSFASGFGPYQMIRIRFRDSSGHVVDDDPFMHGWWTPLIVISDLGDTRRLPSRRVFRVPGHGHVDLPRDINAFMLARHQVDRIAGPCEVQIALVGYPGRQRGQEMIRVESEWQPGPCPVVDSTRP